MYSVLHFKLKKEDQLLINNGLLLNAGECFLLRRLTVIQYNSYPTKSYSIRYTMAKHFPP